VSATPPSAPSPPPPPPPSAASGLALPRDRPPAAAPAPEPASANLSQWSLIRRRFARHRLALASLHVLVFLYAMALFAEFIAPRSPDDMDVGAIFAPPQAPRFDFEHGLHVPALKRHIDPITLKNDYAPGEGVVRIGLLVRGEPYKLFGLIPAERRLFGALPGADGSPPPHAYHLLGADRYGRDIFSRLVHGARVSLSIGLVSIAVTFLLGVSVGGLSGYVGGRTDNLIQRVIEIINAFPQLPLWLALAAVMPPHWSPLTTYFAITVVLSLLGWTGLARVVRGKILSLREEDYAVAARLLGASHPRILFRHLLPGFTSHIIVTLTLGVPGMILGETALSFLGLGLRPPVVSWGVMLQDCLNLDVVANYPWLLMPVVFIILTVLAFNFLGDGLRDAADPYAGR
jgi:peptide/nickel transport system permease protein